MESENARVARLKALEIEDVPHCWNQEIFVAMKKYIRPPKSQNNLMA
jgi:hypothetical protein